jgi:6-phosphogluconolactonase (cycloisomerase 2 family)
VLALIAIVEIAELAAPPPVLTYMEVHKDGVNGVDGLDGAQSVTLSPDGMHLYAAGRNEDAVAVFSRDSTTGALTFVEVQRNGVGGVDGLDQVSSLTLSPDGKHLYSAGFLDHAVAVFSRNTATGALTFVEVHEDGVGGVDGLFSAISVAVSPDGKHLYAAGFGRSQVAVFSRNSTTGSLTFVEVIEDGVGGVDGLWGAHSVAVSPDGKHLYAAGQTDDAVAVFSRNSTTGALNFLEIQRDGAGGVDGLGSAHWVAVSPDGSHLYVAGSSDDAVAAFSVAATSTSTPATSTPTPVPTTTQAALLTFLEVHEEDVAGVEGLDGASSVAVSPDVTSIPNSSIVSVWTPRSPFLTTNRPSSPEATCRLTGTNSVFFMFTSVAPAMSAEDTDSRPARCITPDTDISATVTTTSAASAARSPG